MAWQEALDSMRLKLTRENLQTLQIAVGFFIVAIILRTFQISNSGLWSDELFSATLALDTKSSENFFDFRWVQLIANPDDSWFTRKSTDLTPYLFDITLIPWARLFGSSELSLRMLPAIFGSLAVAVFFYFADKLVARRTALTVAVIFLILPSAVSSSQDLRAYALTSLLAITALGLFALDLKEQTKGEWNPKKRLILALSLLSATHYTGLFLALLIIVSGLYFLSKSKVRIRTLPRFAPVFILPAPAIIMSLPTLLFVGSGGFAWAKYSLADIWTTLIPDMLSYTIPGGALAGAVVLLFTTLEKFRKSSKTVHLESSDEGFRNLAINVFLLYAVVLVIYASYSAYRTGIWASRYSTVLGVVALFILLLYFESRKSRLSFFSVAIIMSLFAMYGTTQYFIKGRTNLEEYREAAAYINEIYVNEDKIILGWEPNFPYYNFYLSRTPNYPSMSDSIFPISDPGELTSLCRGEVKRIIIFEHATHTFETGMQSCKNFRKEKPRMFRGIKVLVYSTSGGK